MLNRMWVANRLRQMRENYSEDYAFRTARAAYCALIRVAIEKETEAHKEKHKILYKLGIFKEQKCFDDWLYNLANEVCWENAL